MSQKLIFTDRPGAELQQLIGEYSPSGDICVITDSNAGDLALPRLRQECPTLAGCQPITIEAGDDHKDIASLASIWQALTDRGATRHSLVINLGGGMITDLGGMAAATFKRGVRFINIPTTLLGAVDAAVGGKTGINFAGLKNEVGVFREADAVIISAIWFDTLPRPELLSGYGEVIKHALLSGQAELSEVLCFDPVTNPSAMLPLLQRSVSVKRRIVEEDPCEKGLRKALNLGHTAAHAFEALGFSRGTAVPHGHAVAWGLVTDLILSHMLLGFPSDTLHQVAQFISEHYPAPAIGCRDYDTLIDYMHHDKKNTSSDAVNFTLLHEPGRPEIDHIVDAQHIKAALDITRDLLHI